MLDFFKQIWAKAFGKGSESIEVFVRHCYASTASAHKMRYPNFSRKGCYQNLIKTLNNTDTVRVTFFLDRASAKNGEEEHFLKNQNQFPVIEIDAGTEALSFLKMIDHVLAKKMDGDTIVYFLEDDYIHRLNWITILKEGFSIDGVDYVTLFDHKDKYVLSAYPDLQSRVFHTQSCHWRTTPSTTNTYAMRFKTLKRDADIHYQFSAEREITADHEKFKMLQEKGAILISSIPGWATHVEPEFASPCINWENIIEKNLD